MSAIRLAARRLPRASKFVPAFDSPVQRRLASTSNAPQNVKDQAKVCVVNMASTNPSHKLTIA
jgi:acetylornithine aminotransferase